MPLVKDGEQFLRYSYTFLFLFLKTLLRCIFFSLILRILYNMDINLCQSLALAPGKHSKAHFPQLPHFLPTVSELQAPHGPLWSIESWFLCRVVDKGLILFFVLYTSSFTSIIYPRCCLFSNAFLGHLWQTKMPIIRCNHVWIFYFVLLTCMFVLWQYHVVFITIAL